MQINDIPAMASAKHILVVDDDERLRSLLSKFLRENGFLVTKAKDAEDARAKLKQLEFDLIVMDVMMPGEDGVSLTSSLKKDNIPEPIILLTALGEVNDRIKGLEVGADDYLPKPFDPRELLLRINAIIKRTSVSTENDRKVDYTLGGYKFDIERGELVNEENDRVILTQVEATLLKAFFAKAGEIISREDLADACSIDAAERTIDVQITRLRKKIEPDAKTPKYLQTVRGKGYILRLD